MIKLRPYQFEAIEKTRAEFAKGINSTLINMTMGMGKTESFLGLLAAERDTYKSEGRHFRALILAHREELVYQPRDRVAKNWTHALPIPGIVKGRENEAKAEIVVATVQTLMRRKKKGAQYGRFHRLRKLLAHGCFTHVITDECHHAVAKSYMGLYRALRAVNPDLRHLGVTATPKRADEDGLIRVYKSVAFRRGLKWAIENGFLSPFVARGYKLPVSIRQARVVGGDYAAGDLNKLLSADNVEEVIVKKWLSDAKLPDGSYRQTMVFCAGVVQAERMAIAFRAAGIEAEFASGTTEKKERRRLISRFKQGEITLLSNCALWTEGFDAPMMSCVIMARPTKSSSLYLQAVGRGLRKYPGKNDALIMDFAPQGGRDLIGAGDLLGVPAAQKKRTEEAIEEDTVLDVFGLDSRSEGIDADPDEIIMEVLDFFANNTKLQFTHDGRVATANINKDRTVAVVFPQESRIAAADELKYSDRWSPLFDDTYEAISSYQVVDIPKRGAAGLVGMFSEWETAVLAAEDYANGDIDRTLAEKAKRWRKSPASDAQRGYAKKLGVWREGMSRGQCAQAITHKKGLDSLRDGRFIK